MISGRVKNERAESTGGPDDTWFLHLTQLEFLELHKIYIDVSAWHQPAKPEVMTGTWCNQHLPENLSSTRQLLCPKTELALSFLLLPQIQKNPSSWFHPPVQVSHFSVNCFPSHYKLGWLLGFHIFFIKIPQLVTKVCSNQRSQTHL